MRNVALLVVVLLSGFGGYRYAQAQAHNPVYQSVCNAQENWVQMTTPARPGDPQRNAKFCIQGVLVTADQMRMVKAADGSLVYSLSGDVTLTIPPKTTP